MVVVKCALTCTVPCRDGCVVWWKSAAPGQNLFISGASILTFFERRGFALLMLYLNAHCNFVTTWRLSITSGSCLVAVRLPGLLMVRWSGGDGITSTAADVHPVISHAHTHERHYFSLAVILAPWCNIVFVKQVWGRISQLSCVMNCPYIKLYFSPLWRLIYPGFPVTWWQMDNVNWQVRRLCKKKKSVYLFWSLIKVDFTGRAKVILYSPSLIDTVL